MSAHTSFGHLLRIYSGGCFSKDEIQRISKATSWLHREIHGCTCNNNIKNFIVQLMLTIVKYLEY